VDAFMVRKTIVGAFMQTALDAEEVAGSTLRSTKLDAGA